MSGFVALARLVKVRPVSSWPGARTAPADRTTSRFTGSWSSTVTRLATELEALDATRVVLEVYVREQDLRLDGLPRANAKIDDPGVVLSFDSKHGPLRYACDTFERPRWGDGAMQDDWQHNVRAIALGLEALRKVERYGITRRGEQYAGWKALPAPISDGSTHMTHGDAVALIENLSGIDGIDHDPVARKNAIRRARAEAHPDRNDGQRVVWDLIETAVKVIDR